MSTWILLRGLARENRHWLAFPKQLASELPEARVICLDLPGNGELNAQTSPIRIEDMAAFCRSELTRLSVPPPYHLLAISMGGMVATAWAAAHPEEVVGCVLINTSFAGFSPIHHRFRPKAWAFLLRFFLAPSRLGRERLIFGLTSQLVEPAEPIIAEWVSICHTRPVGLQNALRQLIAAARFRAPSNAPVQTLVLASAEDQLADPRCSMAIARCWQCDLAVHPWAGHDLPLDDGTWVTKAVRAWLTRTP